VARGEGLAAELRQLILEDLPARFEAIGRALEALAARGETEELLRHAHNLAGVGGTIGYPALSRLGAAWEVAISAYPHLPEEGRAALLRASREAVSYLEELLGSLRAGQPEPGEAHPAFALLQRCAGKNGS
jgi:HPt (histidine-containing phosphotransfer) domain-containing protein